MHYDISIIVPIYNVEKYLRKCLESLTAQTKKELQIICVNDGSTDHSLGIIREFVSLYGNFHLIDKKNAGYGAAINDGFAIAEGEYVGIVEPDDFIADEMYQLLYERAQAMDKPDIVKCGFYEISEDGSITKDTIPLIPSDRTLNIHTYPDIVRIHPSVWSCIYKRHFLETHKIRMVEAKGAAWVDNPFFFQTFCLAKSFCWLDKPLYFYRVFSGNSSNNLKDCSIPISRMSEIFDFFDAHPEYQTFPLLAHAYRRAIIYIGLIEDNPNYSQADRELARILVSRMDRRVTAACLKPAHTRRYNHYAAKPLSLLSSCVYTTSDYLSRAFRYLRKHGFAQTVKRSFGAHR